MAESTHPNLPLKYDWDLGEPYKPGMDTNLRMLGAVVQLSVKSRTSDEPGSPSDGDRYIHNGGTWSVGSAGDVIARIAGSWYAYSPETGWQCYVADEGNHVTYDGGWVAGSATWGSITGTLSNQTDLQNALDGKLSLDGSLAMTGDLDLGSHKLINVLDPVSPQEASTKGYVDAAINGLDWQESVIDQQGRPPGSPGAGDRYLASYIAHSIVGVDTTNEIVTVSGDQRGDFAAGDTLTINGSTGNDGTYSVASVAYDSTNDETDITVNEDVTDSTADGEVRITVGAWNGHRDEIAEYDGSSWTFVAPDEGFALLREADDTALIWNATSWINFGSTVKHNQTQGLQGGTSSEYYHLTSAQHTSVVNIVNDGYAEAMDQGVATTDAPDFGGATISATQYGYLGGLGSAPLEDNDLAANGGSIAEIARDNGWVSQSVGTITLGSESSAQGNSTESGDGFLATPWLYAQAIEASDERGASSTGIAMGSGGATNEGATNADQIVAFTDGLDRLVIDANGVNGKNGLLNQGNAVLDTTNLAANGGSVPEVDRSNTFTGDQTVVGKLSVDPASGSAEGGQIQLGPDPDTSNAAAVIDVRGDLIRIFEPGGSSKNLKIDYVKGAIAFQPYSLQEAGSAAISALYINGVQGTKGDGLYSTVSTGSSDWRHYQQGGHGRVAQTWNAYWDGTNSVWKGIVGSEDHVFLGMADGSISSESPGIASALFAVAGSAGADTAITWETKLEVLKAGVKLGDPTGAEQGANTINTEGVFQQGNPVLASGDTSGSNLPTSDPAVSGQLYADSGDSYRVKVSQG